MKNHRNVVFLLLWTAVWSLLSCMQYVYVFSNKGKPHFDENRIGYLPASRKGKSTLFAKKTTGDELSRLIAKRTRKIPEKAPCLVVYHVPKTGGLTLFHHLHSLADDLGWSTMSWYTRAAIAYRNTSPPQNPNYNNSAMHIGHITPRFENVTHTQACYKMTLLREPVDRVISAFYFHRHKEQEWPSCLEKDCRLWHEYHNDVVRRFANRGNAWHSYDLESYLQEQDSRDEIDSSLLTDAQRFLEGLDLVCFLEDIRGCVEDVSRALLHNVQTEGKQIQMQPFKNTVVNKNTKRKIISVAMKQRIAKANALDMQLYEWARGRFSQSSINQY